MVFKIKETLLGTSIAIIFVFFVAFGIKAFYKEPRFENFCERGLLIDYAASEGGYYPRVKEHLQNDCADEIAQYEGARKNCAGKNSDLIFDYNQKGCQIAKCCTSCNVDFKQALNIYNRNVFIVAGIVGIIAIIVGAILRLTSVSSGLFGGGVLTIIYGTTNYWSKLADWARFVILGIALAVLIYLGYKKFGVRTQGR